MEVGIPYPDPILPCICSSRHRNQDEKAQALLIAPASFVHSAILPTPSDTRANAGFRGKENFPLFERCSAISKPPLNVTANGYPGIGKGNMKEGEWP